MQELLRHSSVKDVSSIIRVGGFAESPMLQAAITNAFKDKKKRKKLLYHEMLDWNLINRK